MNIELLLLFLYFFYVLFVSVFIKIMVYENLLKCYDFYQLELEYIRIDIIYMCS
jgi:hypothetical protein